MYDFQHRVFNLATSSGRETQQNELYGIPVTTGMGVSPEYAQRFIEHARNHLSPDHFDLDPDISDARAASKPVRIILHGAQRHYPDPDTGKYFNLFTNNFENPEELSHEFAEGRRYHTIANMKHFLSNHPNPAKSEEFRKVIDALRANVERPERYQSWAYGQTDPYFYLHDILNHMHHQYPDEKYTPEEEQSGLGASGALRFELQHTKHPGVPLDQLAEHLQQDIPDSRVHPIPGIKDNYNFGEALGTLTRGMHDFIRERERPSVGR